MIENGKVIAKKGDYVTVRFMRKSACGKCGMCAMKPNEPHIDLDLKNNVNAEKGDEVEVSMTGSLVKASLAVYLIPLFFAFLGMLVGYLLGLPEWGMLICFFAALAVGLVPLKLLDKKWGRKKMQPEIIRVSDNGSKGDVNG